MKSPTRSPPIRRAVERATKLGYRVDFVPYVECASYPGFLGFLAGLCDRETKTIRVKTTGASKAQLAAVIEHELEHAEGKDEGKNLPEFGLKCGGELRF